MTTKEFIKMLQDADPSGEAHIRMEGGVPYSAQLKPGYYDGPYSYIDEEGNFCQTTKGEKVDLYCKDSYDIISDYYDEDKTPEENWEVIENKFKFDYNAYSDKGQRTERQEQYMKGVYKQFEEYSGFKIDFYEMQLQNNIEQGKLGWTWFQNKLVDSDKPGIHKYYTWKVYNEYDKEQGSNLANTQRIQNNENWVKVDNNVMKGYYQWIFQGEINEKPKKEEVKQSFFQRIFNKK